MTRISIVQLIMPKSLILFTTWATILQTCLAKVVSMERRQKVTRVDDNSAIDTNIVTVITMNGDLHQESDDTAASPTPLILPGSALVSTIVNTYTFGPDIPEPASGSVCHQGCTGNAHVRINHNTCLEYVS